MLIPTTNYYIPDGNRLVDVATLARPHDLDGLIADLEMMGENRPGEELSASVYSRSITRAWPGPLPDELIDLLLDEEQSAEFIISISPEDGSTQHLVIRDGRLVEISTLVSLSAEEHAALADELNIFFIPRESARPMAAVRYLDIGPELLYEDEGMSEAFRNFTVEQMRKGPRERITVLQWTE